MGAPPHLHLYRMLMVLVATVVPALGFAAWALVPVFDPFSARVVLSGVAWIGLAATFTPWGRQRAREVGGVVVTLTYGWFLYAATRDGMTQDDAIGLVPLTCAHAVLVRSARELVGAVVFTAGGVLALHVFTPAPAFPVPVFAMLALSLTTAVGWSSMARETLAETLERRVAERTAALAASLAVAEAESLERARAERDALRASRAKSVFLANMSHELRTPLNAILGYTQLTVEALEDRPDAVADLGLVERAAKHLLKLIDGILDLSRVEADELSLDIRRVPLVDVVEEAVAVLPDLLGPHRDVVVDVGDLVVQADRDRLRQVLANLLSNAAKYAPVGDVHVRARRESDRVLVDVIDCGPGIDPELLPTIFDRFVTGELRGDARRGGGTGLGLAICRELVDRMGGRIEASSAPGEGATFTVSLAAGQP
ncbi:MAG: HAMP domain-containing sensor histidine kinase [Myxococcota bacterium]